MLNHIYICPKRCKTNAARKNAFSPHYRVSIRGLEKGGILLLGIDSCQQSLGGVEMWRMIVTDALPLPLKKYDQLLAALDT